MTLYELLHQLQDINYKVTSADFETNVLSVKANLEGDWKNWSVNVHTKDEERLKEEGEELAYNCEKKGYNDAMKKACEVFDEFLESLVEIDLIVDASEWSKEFKEALEEA